MHWFWIALSAPALWAIVVLIDDTLVRKIYRTPYVSTIVAGLFGAIPGVLIMRGTLTLPSIEIIGISLLAGFLTVAYYFFYFSSLEVEQPSVVSAILNLAVVMVPIMAFIFLNEALTTRQYIGLGLIILSTVGLGIINTTKKIRFSKATLYLVLASFFYAIASVISKYAYDRAEFDQVYAFFSFGMGVGGIYYLAIFKDRLKVFKKLIRHPNKWLWLLALAEVLNIAAEYTNNLATSLGPVSLVKVIGGVQPLFVLLFAIVLYPLIPAYFREAKSKRIDKKIILMITILFGLYLTN